MRKALLILVALLAVPAMADVAVTAADLGGGLLEITVTPSAGAAVRGVALKLTADANGSVDDAMADATVSGLNTNIDWLFSGGSVVGDTPAGEGTPLADPAGPGVLDAAGGVQVMSLCSGYLDAAGTQMGQTGVMVFTVQFDLTADCTVAIEEDGLRGGIVGDDIGAVTVQASQLLVGSAPCYGDFNGDGFTNTQDMGLIINVLSAAGAPYVIPDTDPAYNADMDLNSDNFLNTQDMGLIINYLSAAGAPYVIPCP